MFNTNVLTVFKHDIVNSAEVMIHLLRYIGQGNNRDVFESICYLELNEASI